MNGTYYQNPTFPSAVPNNSNDISVTLDKEVSINDIYIENILNNNIGKFVNTYVSFPNSNEIKDITFTGIIEKNGKDYLIISNPETGKWYLIPNKYINYIEFEEEIKF